MRPDILTTLLPNGLSVQHVSASDLAFLYEETFQSNAYLHHGVQLRPGGTVIDIGERPQLCRRLVLQLLVTGKGKRKASLYCLHEHDLTNSHAPDFSRVEHRVLYNGSRTGGGSQGEVGVPW